MVRKTFAIPAGYAWSHAEDLYKDSNGNTWDDETNVFRDRDGNELKAVGAVTPPETVEQQIQRVGATQGPRVTPADVDAVIIAEQFEQPVGTLLTICILTLKNGFTVTGESACASPENFNAEVGKRVSREDAKRKIWPLLGYALRDKIHAATNGA